MQLTEDQATALRAVELWLEHDERQTLTLAGLAGVGKSTIAKEIVRSAEEIFRPKREESAYDYDDDPSSPVAVSSFTGRAVSVLRKKGMSDARTLHSLMYEPVESRDAKGARSLTFKKRFSLPYKLIIVDEASMINRTLYDDLLSFGKKVLWVGDHGQLEPIGDNPNVMATPDIKLEKILRQAEDSRIIKFAHHLREGRRPPQKVYGDDLTVTNKWALGDRIFEADMVICGFNKTRIATNKRIREHLGRQAPVEVGDRLMCLKNNRNLGLYNGMVVDVEKIHDIKNDTAILDFSEDGGGKYYRIPVPFSFFNGGGTDEERAWAPKDQGIFDYGYATTCHRAQGSEADRVVVIEEIWHEKWDERRWRYTAASRARKSLVYSYG